MNTALPGLMLCWRLLVALMVLSLGASIAACGKHVGSPVPDNDDDVVNDDSGDDGGDDTDDGVEDDSDDGAAACDCPEGEYCDADNLCQLFVMHDLCSHGRLAVLVGGATGDDAAAQVAKAGLALHCAAATVNEVLASDTAAFLENGRPTLGTDTVVVVLGGGYSRLTTQYMQSQGQTPLTFAYNAGTNMVQFSRRSDGEVLFERNFADITPSNDVFLIELAIEPVSQTRLLIAYGFESGGTMAAAWYLSEHIAEFTAGGRWMIVEWIDKNDDEAPDAGDTFEILRQG